MRNDLGWRKQPDKSWVTMIHGISRTLCADRAVWLDEEDNDFLYGNGESPFAGDENGGNKISTRFGIVGDWAGPGMSGLTSSRIC
ncbi:hypothetical protein Ct61P_01856 [Colletotrichum tofieldiae]|nr:hypothetical protein Ct61P_01856 [Colletotrichum tofieldiae]